MTGRQVFFHRPNELKTPNYHRLAKLTANLWRVKEKYPPRLNAYYLIIYLKPKDLSMKKFILIAVLFFSVSVMAQPGSWKQVGGDAGWANTMRMAQINDKIYTIDNTGAFFETIATTGVFKKIGGSVYGNTAFMFAGNGSLYTIENSGSLYAINTANGSWKQIGSAGAWSETNAGVILNGKLYTTAKTGVLTVTNLSTGAQTKLGDPDFAATWKMWTANGKLYTIETSGTLYEINPADGKWKQVGADFSLKYTIAGVVFNNLFYAAQLGGELLEINLTTSESKQLGTAAFGSTVFMTAGTKKIYSIESSGSLFEINVN
jgi:hypothetical protein